jgi:hypothetical protein
MSSMHGSDLSVRRYERYACDLPASVSIAGAHAESVRPSRSIVAADGRLETRVVDCSQGGLGLQSRVFLPIGCRLQVRFGYAGRTIQVLVRVQRAMMVSRHPAYYLGTALDDADTDRAVEHVVASLKASGAPVVREKPCA